MDNLENFLADKPISEEKDDRFQRYNFAKRIAETIYNRNSSESIVLGLYGAWGEGKTSVLNFIKHELKPHYPQFIYFSFNPWRFTDESALLVSYFNTLALEVKNSIEKPLKKKNGNFFSRLIKPIKTSWYKRKGPLKTSKETIGEIIKEYGKLVSIVGAGETVETIGRVFSNVDIEKLKERIENLLLNHKKRIVIFIDDIDRLEQDEIHSIFRLVKLTGDFPFTTFVLAFDENIISASIGKRFGLGDPKSGENFLEKIIQIPIKIPLAQKSALKTYCFQLVDKAIGSSQIKLTEIEERNFVDNFTSCFLIRLNTPRLAIRYGNALSFSLPLLKGEVNYVDLLLIEAIRVFYPEIYELIRTQPDYFIGSYTDQFTKQINKEKIEQFKSIFSKCCNKFNDLENQNAKEILLNMFPNLGKVWGSKDWDWNHGDNIKQYNEKRISSSHYFNRYFSYTVIEGDISDVAFNELLAFISDGDYLEKLERVISFIKFATPDNFIEKIRFREKLFNSSTAINLVKVLGVLGEYFPRVNHSMLKYTSAFNQAAYFIHYLIRYQIDEAHKFEMLKWIIENAKPLQFAYEVFDLCRGDNSHSKELFSYDQNKQLAGELIKRAKALSGNKPIWIDFNLESRYLLSVWANDFDKNDMNNYVVHHLNSDPHQTIELIKVFTPYIHSSAYPEPYYGDLEKSNFDWLKQVLDKDFIYEKVQEILGTSIISADDYVLLEQKQTDKNLLKQFVYWFNKDKTDIIQDAKN